jgi:hypothetical protein
MQRCKGNTSGWHCLRSRGYDLVVIELFTMSSSHGVHACSKPREKVLAPQVLAVVVPSTAEVGADPSVAYHVVLQPEGP